MLSIRFVRKKIDEKRPLMENHTSFRGGREGLCMLSGGH